MKKVMLLLATLLIGGMMFTGCHKQVDPTPEPTPTSFTIAYLVADTCADLTLSPCFRLNVTYLDANGQEVTENGVSLPWVKLFEVTSPFHAKMSCEYVYNEAEVPETVIFGKNYGIGVYEEGKLVISMNGGFGSTDKERFLEDMAQHPDKLRFTAEQDF